MAQFKGFSPNVEIIGKTVFDTAKAFPNFLEDYVKHMLVRHNIDNPILQHWYPQKNILSFYKEINDGFGPNTLFDIGKNIAKQAKLPSGIDTLEKALKALNVAYQYIHRHGDIGFYKVHTHEKYKKTIVMQCKTPYPCALERGIITSTARKFKVSANVVLDSEHPSRSDGADDSWYIISY